MPVGKLATQLTGMFVGRFGVQPSLEMFRRYIWHVYGNSLHIICIAAVWRKRAKLEREPDHV